MLKKKQRNKYVHLLYHIGRFLNFFYSKRLLFVFINLSIVDTFFLYNNVRSDQLNTNVNISALEKQYSSAIVVDATNGKILYSYRPDMKIFPASLTKMMTAYIVFDALDKGVIGVNDCVNGVILDKNIKPNKNCELTIKDLIYKMVVKSLNDVTSILAKEIMGDEKLFISEMNNIAKSFGMRNTNFSNTHGLYDENHYSTARDIAKLSIRLVYDFPQYIDFFGVTNYIDENREYNTKTSDIQDNMYGITGGKTGHINASGYNLAVWGKYKNMHLFVVMIGADDPSSRDRLVVSLLNLVLKNNNIEPTKSNVNDDFFKKVCDFIGIDYLEYLTQIQVERIK